MHIVDNQQTHSRVARDTDAGPSGLGLSGGAAGMGLLGRLIAAANGTTSVTRGNVVDLTSLVKSLVISAVSGDGVSIRAVEGGNVAFVDGVIRYVAPSKVGFDSFAYTVSDHYGETATGVVNIVVRHDEAAEDGKAGQGGDSTSYFSNLLARGERGDRVAWGGDVGGSGVLAGGINFGEVSQPSSPSMQLGGMVWQSAPAHDAAPNDVHGSSSPDSRVAIAPSQGDTAANTTLRDSGKSGDLLTLASALELLLVSEATGRVAQVPSFNFESGAPSDQPVFVDNGGTPSGDSASGGPSPSNPSSGYQPPDSAPPGGAIPGNPPPRGSSSDNTPPGGSSSNSGSPTSGGSSSAPDLPNPVTSGGTTTSSSSPPSGGSSTGVTPPGSSSSGGSSSDPSSPPSGGTSTGVTPPGGSSSGGSSSDPSSPPSGGTSTGVTPPGGSSSGGSSSDPSTPPSGGTSSDPGLPNPITSGGTSSSSSPPLLPAIPADIIILSGDKNTVTGPAVAGFSNGLVGDTLYGSATGHSTIQGDSYDRTITAYGYDNTIVAGGGNDTITAGDDGANVTVSNNDGDNTVEGGNGNNLITLGNGNNAITLAGYSNTITLGDGDNLVSSGAGKANLTLGNGNNAVETDGYNNVISVGTGTNVIQAGGGYETVSIAGGTDVVNAGGYFDSFTLGGGNTTITGMLGYGTITLTSSFSTSDTVDFADLSGASLVLRGTTWYILTAGGGDIATISLPSGESPVLSSDGNGGELLSLVIGPPPPPVPPVTITETTGGVTLNLSPVTTTVNLYGYGNTVTGGDGNRTIDDDQGQSSITLGSGNNTVSSNGYYETISLGVGGNGNNTISGTMGWANISTGDGNETISLSGYDNTVVLGTGTHTVTGDQGGSTFIMGGDTSSLTLSGVGDTIIIGLGTTSDNTVKGTEGSTSITTGDGNQTIDAGGFYNTITLGNGDSTITGIQGYSTVTTGGGDSTISVAGNDNTINTTTGNDTITLGGADNIVTGGLGDDVISGGMLNTYVLNGLSSSGGELEIMDFTATSGDVLDLSQVTKGLAPGWYLSAANDAGALDISINQAGGASNLVATLHGVAASASLATLIAAHSIIA